MPRPTTPPLSISIRRHHNDDTQEDDEQEYNNKNISSEACYYNNDTSSSSSSTNESTISSIGIDDDGDSSTSYNYNSNIKMKEVTITVLSMHGIIIKRSQKSKKKKKRFQMEEQGEEEDDRFSVVASFMQSISNERIFQTHVPSLQVDLQSNHDANNSSSSSQPIIHWPPHPKKKNDSTATHDEHHHQQALSTLKFIGDFLPEEEEEDSLLHSEEEEQRFIPKTCPINLSILRNGKMITIGSINLIVNGEENGMMSINIPITNTIKQNSKLNRAGGGKTTLLLKKSMAKIKGDVYKFGIAEDAMIRVLVKVTPVLPHHNNNDYLDINRFGASDAAVQNYISTIEGEDDEDEDVERLMFMTTW